MDHVIAIDLGGTKLSWALVDRDYNFLLHERTETPQTTEAVISKLSEIILETSESEQKIVGVGIGVAGLVDHDSETVVASPNLPLTGVPLGHQLNEKFDLPCSIDNDANLAILGELYSGAGRGKDNLIGLTVGTGIGGGIVLDGKLWRGQKGAAAEFGHIVVDAGGPRCACGNLGCLETRASGTAITVAAKEFVAAHPDSQLGKKVGGDPEKATGPIVSEAARSGDEAALGILAEVGRWLGIGIGSLINVLDPQMIVLGGGVASSIEMALPSVKEAIAQTVIDPRSKDIPLAISQLENRAGLLGAAALVFEGS
ncbi:MAG TPA: ROK family protein [Actinobacteria bacterium]|nr:ROK family protein [Actinomycetota bacterium]